MTEVDYTEQAIDQLENLESATAERIMDKVDEAAKWTKHRLDQLSGWVFYKLRAGDYRAIITWIARRTSSSSRQLAIDGTSTIGICRRNRNHDVL